MFWQPTLAAAPDSLKLSGTGQRSQLSFCSSAVIATMKLLYQRHIVGINQRCCVVTVSFHLALFTCDCGSLRAMLDRACSHEGKRQKWFFCFKNNKLLSVSVSSLLCMKPITFFVFTVSDFQILNVELLFYTPRLKPTSVWRCWSIFNKSESQILCYQWQNSRKCLCHFFFLEQKTVRIAFLASHGKNLWLWLPNLWHSDHLGKKKILCIVWAHKWPLEMTANLI